jgi:hypothetical protein
VSCNFWWFKMWAGLGAGHACTKRRMNKIIDDQIVSSCQSGASLLVDQKLFLRWRLVLYGRVQNAKEVTT